MIVTMLLYEYRLISFFCTAPFFFRCPRVHSCVPYFFFLFPGCIIVTLLLLCVAVLQCVLYDVVLSVVLLYLLCSRPRVLLVLNSFPV